MIDSQMWEKGTSNIMEKHGVFFAFNQEQFDSAKKEGVQYTSVFPQGFCPHENACHFLEEYRVFNRNYAAKELDKYGEKEIIMYQLRNHEFQLEPDVERVAEAVAVYGLTEDDVRKYIPAYMKLCNENDWY